MKSVKIIIEQRKNGFVAYPSDFGSQDLIREGATHKEALENVRTAIHEYLENWGRKRFENGFNRHNALINLFVEEIALEANAGLKYNMTKEEITKIGEAAVDEFLAEITPEKLARYQSYNRRDDDED